MWKFNFQEFFSYIEKNNRVSELLLNREIILILGTMGAGKSTTIHYLSGSEMIETSINGLKHIYFNNVLSKDLIQVKINPFRRCETR